MVRCVKPCDSRLRYAAQLSLMTVVPGSIQSRIMATRVSAVKQNNMMKSHLGGGCDVMEMTQ